MHGILNNNDTTHKGPVMGKRFQGMTLYMKLMFYIYVYMCYISHHDWYNLFYALHFTYTDVNLDL